MTNSRRAGTKEDGFALLVALVALVALTALATGGIWVSSTSFRSTDAFEKGHRAFYAANAGLQQFLGTYGANPPSSDSYDFGNGEVATVTAVRTRREPDVYHIQSVGTVEVAGEVVAERTVGIVAAVNAGPIPLPNSSMFSPNGVYKEGDQGVISGYDQFDPDNPGQCPNGQVDDQNGITVSDSAGYDQSGDTLVAEGTPNDTLHRDQQQMLDDLDLDWQSIVDGESVRPDVTVDPDDMSNWPDFDTIAADEWPVIYATGKDKRLELGSGEGGHGLLITRGSMKLKGGLSWDGMVVTGGEMNAGSGEQYINGATMSGLNLLLGETVDGADQLNGEKYFRYHSCHVQKARDAASFMEAVPGTWYQG